jgi:hypothetical protein
MSTTESDLAAAAYHEAGHAVASFLYGREFEGVSIDGGGEDPGSCTVTAAFEDVLSLVAEGWDTPSDLARVRNGLVTVLAGSSAEEYFLGEPAPSEGDYDEEMAEAMAETLATSGSATEAEYLDTAWEEAEHLWQRTDVWAAVQVVAEALLRDRRLTFEEVVSIVREASPDLEPLDLHEERERWVWDDDDGWVRCDGLAE